MMPVIPAPARSGDNSAGSDTIVPAACCLRSDVPTERMKKDKHHTSFPAGSGADSARIPGSRRLRNYSIPAESVRLSFFSSFSPWSKLYIIGSNLNVFSKKSTDIP